MDTKIQLDFEQHTLPCSEVSIDSQACIESLIGSYCTELCKKATDVSLPRFLCSWHLQDDEAPASNFHMQPSCSLYVNPVPS